MTSLHSRGESSPELRSAVEEFLHHEADLLDRWLLDEWLALFTDDARFLVPSPDRPDGDPSTDLFLVQDDRFLLEQRVESLMAKTAWAESPHSTTSHLVSNVRATDLGGGDVRATAKFLVTRARRDTVTLYPGRYEFALELGGPAGFRIRVRKAVLALETLRPQGRVSFII